MKSKRDLWISLGKQNPTSPQEGNDVALEWEPRIPIRLRESWHFRNQIPSPSTLRIGFCFEVQPLLTSPQRLMLSTLRTGHFGWRCANRLLLLDNCFCLTLGFISWTLITPWLAFGTCCLSWTFGKWLRSCVLYTLSLEFIKKLLVPVKWFVSLQHTFAETLLSARPHATAVKDVPTQQMSLMTRGNWGWVTVTVACEDEAEWGEDASRMPSSGVGILIGMNSASPRLMSTQNLRMWP